MSSNDMKEPIGRCSKAHAVTDDITQSDYTYPPHDHDPVAAAENLTTLLCDAHYFDLSWTPTRTHGLARGSRGGNVCECRFVPSSVHGCPSESSCVH